MLSISSPLDQLATAANATLSHCFFCRAAYEKENMDELDIKVGDLLTCGTRKTELHQPIHTFFCGQCMVNKKDEIQQVIENLHKNELSVLKHVLWTTLKGGHPLFWEHNNGVVSICAESRQLCPILLLSSGRDGNTMYSQ
jgi:hypothetical protein